MKTRKHTETKECWCKPKVVSYKKSTKYTYTKKPIPKYKRYTMKQRIADLKSCKDTQCSKGNWDNDNYMTGMANGLLLAWNIIAEPYGAEINYFNCKKKKVKS